MKKILIGIIIVVVFLIILINYMMSNYEDKMEELVINEIDLSQVEDGTYNGEYSLFPIIVKVKVEVKDNKITDIEIVEHQTGQGKPGEAIIDDVIEEQSVKVDVITKATGSSKVILKAIENALGSK